MAVKIWYPRNTSSLSGAGPFTVATPLPDLVSGVPGGGVTQVVNLPSVASSQILADEVLLVANAGTGADMVLVLPNGTDTIGGASFFRVFQNGSVYLVANKVTNAWNVLSEIKGYPTTIVVNASNSGSDANPGTAALPVRTIRKALELLDVRWTGAQADIQLTSGYADSSSVGRPVLIPGPKPGTGGIRPRIKGPAQKDAGFGTVTITGGSAATTSKFQIATFASIGGLATNGGADFFFKGLSGNVNNVVVPMRATSATSAEFIRNVVAIPTGTFQITQPDATVQLSDAFLPGTGNQLELVDLDYDLTVTGVSVTSSTSRILTSFLATDGITTFTNIQVLGDATVTQDTGKFAGTTVGSRGGVFLFSLAEGSLLIVGVDASAGEPATSITVNSNGSLSVQTAKFFESGTVVANENAFAQVSFSDISASSFPFANSAIVVEENSLGELRTVTGDIGGSAPAGVSALTASSCNVDAGTTITASGSDVVVGALGVKSWATISGDVSSNVFDGGAANGASGVSVRRTL